jgi:hypothetical protein
MKVILTAWKKGLLKISLAQLIKESSGCSLKPAKERVDMLLRGDKVTMEFESEDAARRFLAEAEKIGAVGKLGSGDEKIA